MKKKILCVIPARKNSRRIKLKNFKKLGNYTLVEHAIIQAKKSNLFSDIYVSSDMGSMNKICKKHKVNFFFRKKYSDNLSPVSMATYDLLRNMNKNYDTVVQLMATCPLRNSIDIKKSLNNFFIKKSKFQISAFRISWLHFNWAYVQKKSSFKKFFKKEGNLTNDKIYFPTGAIWIANVKDFLKAKTFYGPKFNFYEIDWISAIDVDTEKDLKNARRIYKLSNI